jgi:biotin carboxyl carrier protein
MLANKRFGGASYHQPISFSTEQGTARVNLATSKEGNQAKATVKDFEGGEVDLEIVQTKFESSDTVDSILGNERLKTTFIANHKDSSRLDMFSKGRQAELQIARPAWVEQLDEVHSAASTGAITAPTPSRVVAVLVTADQEVKQGQTLVILEGKLVVLIDVVLNKLALQL